MSLSTNALRAALLPAVAIHGWSSTAIEEAAQALNVPAGQLHYQWQATPRDLRPFIEALWRLEDQAMVDALGNEDLVDKRIPEKVAWAVMQRLGQMQPNKQAWKKTLQNGMKPQNWASYNKWLYATVDAIWRGIGDRSIDFNFYTKRLTLFMVYKSVLLYWLQDDSDDLTATREFLARQLVRLHKVMSIPRSVMATAKRFLGH